MPIWFANALTVVVLLAIFSLGCWAGTAFTWAFILAYTVLLVGAMVILVLLLRGGTFMFAQEGTQYILGMTIIGIPAFIVGSWLAYLVHIVGVFRH